MPVTRSSSAFVLVGIFVAMLAVHIPLASETQLHDGLYYASRIRSDSPPPHPNHLIFAPVVGLFYRLGCSLGLGCEALATAQLHNILVTSVALSGFYLAYAIVSRSVFWSLLATIFIGTSHNFLIYTTQAESHAASMAGLGICSAALAWSQGTGSQLRAYSLAGSGLALAVLYNQPHVMFVLPILVFGLLSFDRKELCWALFGVALAGSAVLAAYVGVLYAEGGPMSVTQLVRFAQGHGASLNPDWGDMKYFSPAGVRALLQSQTKALLPVDQPGAVESSVVGVGVLLLAVNSVVQIRRGKVNPRHAGFLYVWLLSYWALFLWWLPSHDKFFLMTTPPLVWLCISSVRSWTTSVRDRGRRALRRLTVVAVCALFGFSNVAFGLVPLHQSRGVYFFEAAALAEAMDRDCVAYGSWGLRTNLEYYFNWQVGKSIRALWDWEVGRRDRPHHRDPRTKRCVVLEVKKILPDRKVYQEGRTGHTHPRLWWGVMSRVFDLQTAADGGLDGRRFRIITTKEDDLFVVVEENTRFGSVMEFMAQLDAAVAHGSGEPHEAFAAWLEKNRAIVDIATSPQ